MTGLPTLTVKLDDGTGTFPYDISTYVRLTEGYTITRGRGDQFSTVSPSTVTLTLDNTDGRFSAGSSTYNIAVDRLIRIAETVGGTTSARFTGYITTLPVAWPDGSDQYALAQVTAADVMARLQRRLMKSVTEQEILADSPGAYYPLSEAQNATGAGDRSGNQRPPLTITGAGAPPVFGTDSLNAWDGLTSCTFGGGQWLGATAVLSPPGTSLTFEASGIFSSPGAAAALMYSVGPGTWRVITLESASGNLGASDFLVGTTSVSGGPIAWTSSGAYDDGRTHHIAVTLSGTTWSLLVDGTPITSGTGTALPPGSSLDLRVGESRTAATLTGVIGHIALYSTVLANPRVSAHADAVLNGHAADTSDQRIARLLGYAGITTTALEAGVQANVPPQTTGGASALDVNQTIATSEGGVFFIRGDGAPALQNRAHRVLETTAAWSLTSDDINPDAQAIDDMQLVFNYATAKAVTGVEQVAQNPTSLAAHDQYPTSFNLLVATDAEALDRANWTVNKQGTPQSHFSSVTVDLLTSSTAIQQAALSREISDRIQITSLPSQTPGGTTLDLVIEGWTETLSATTWSMTFNTSNWIYQAPIVDTASATCDTGSPVYY